MAGLVPSPGCSLQWVARGLGAVAALAVFCGRAATRTAISRRRGVDATGGAGAGLEASGWPRDQWNPAPPDRRLVHGRGLHLLAMTRRIARAARRGGGDRASSAWVRAAWPCSTRRWGSAACSARSLRGEPHAHRPADLGRRRCRSSFWGSPIVTIGLPNPPQYRGHGQHRRGQRGFDVALFNPLPARHDERGAGVRSSPVRGRRSACWRIFVTGSLLAPVLLAIFGPNGPSTSPAWILPVVALLIYSRIGGIDRVSLVDEPTLQPSCGRSPSSWSCR